MRSKTSDRFNLIMKCIVQKPQDRMMSVWIKRIMIVACFLAFFYAYFIQAYSSMALLGGLIAIWSLDSVMTRKQIYFYADLATVTFATCLVDTMFLSGELGQVGAFFALLLAMVSVFILGLLWGNMLGILNCGFVIVVLNLDMLTWIKEIYNPVFCQRFPYLMLSFLASAIFIQYSMTKYSISKQNYRDRLELMVKEGKEERAEVSLNILLAMFKALSTKSPELGGHCESVAEWSRIIARRMGYSASELKRMYYAGLLHDIGKIGVADAYWPKKRMSKKYKDEYQSHVDIGYQIVYKLNLQEITDAVEYHHETYEGSGYRGLSKDSIPVAAAIVSVADKIAHLEDEGTAYEEIMEYLQKQAGKAYDSVIADKAVRSIKDLIREREEEAVFGKVE